MTDDDSVANGCREANGCHDPEGSREADGSGDDANAGEGRVASPVLAGAVGLFAGVAGGIVGTTIAPGNLFLTIVLVAVVVLAVTLGTLRVLPE